MLCCAAVIKRAAGNWDTFVCQKEIKREHLNALCGDSLCRDVLSGKALCSKLVKVLKRLGVLFSFCPLAEVRLRRYIAPVWRRRWLSFQENCGEPGIAGRPLRVF